MSAPGTRTLVFEIGVEEVPSAPLNDAISQLKALAEKALDDARLPYAALDTYGSPRRLVLVVNGLAERQADLSMRAKGPAVKAAFDADGKPTQAAIGFAKGKGVDVADLVRDTENGGEYVFAVVERPGGAAVDVLPALLSALPADLAWVKSQRWGRGSARFIRPVRWLLALFGADVVPATFAGLTAGRETSGHRFLAAGGIGVGTADAYATAMRGAMVVFDQAERARLVRERVEVAATSVGGTAVVPEKTFAEVVNLIEWPTAVVGRFDAEYLKVPREVVETAMTKHQRYFPVLGADGALTDSFVVVHNGDPERSDAIARGHERVIRARLADAAFFYAEDLATPMEGWVARLSTIVFQEKLGTLAAKVGRVEALTGALADLTTAPPDAAAQARRAAHLAKADLVSHVVVEFPTLQGAMGRYYALAAGEDAAVADAIVDHYRPRFAGDAVPSGLPGMLVAAADKLDTIAGIFAIGQGPTGSSDPFALRRAAIGVLAMTLDGGLALRRLDEAVAAAVAAYSGVVKDLSVSGVALNVSTFLNGRLEVILKERGIDQDITAAVLDTTVAGTDRTPATTTGRRDPADALARCAAMQAFRGTDAGRDLLVAFKRGFNLAAQGGETGDVPDHARFGPEERALFDATVAARGEFATLVAKGRYDDALGALAGMRGPVDTFFEKVLVMDDDLAVRANRLKLLNMVGGLFGGFARLEQLEG